MKSILFWGFLLTISHFHANATTEEPQCRECPIGSFKNHTGSTSECTPCNTGQTTDSTASTNFNACRASRDNDDITTAIVAVGTTPTPPSPQPSTTLPLLRTTPRPTTSSVQSTPAPPSQLDPLTQFLNESPSLGGNVKMSMSMTIDGSVNFGASEQNHFRTRVAFALEINVQYVQIVSFEEVGNTPRRRRLQQAITPSLVILIAIEIPSDFLEAVYALATTDNFNNAMGNDFNVLSLSPVVITALDDVVDGTDTTMESDYILIASVAIPVAVVILGVVIGSCCCKKKKKNSQPFYQNEMQYPGPQQLPPLPQTPWVQFPPMQIPFRPTPPFMLPYQSRLPMPFRPTLQPPPPPFFAGTPPPPPYATRPLPQNRKPDKIPEEDEEDSG
jgi:hypothetical protein